MYSHVLVGTDGSVTAARAVEAAARLALAHGGRLTIAHAFAARPTPALDADRVPDGIGWLLTPGGAAEALVAAAVDHTRTLGDLDVDGVARVGTPIGVLLELIAEQQPDVVVVGNADARRALARRSIGTALSRRSPGDVIIVDTVGRPARTGLRRRAA